MRTNGIHDFEKRIARSLRYLDKTDFLPRNKELIKEFHSYLLANGISKARVSRYIRVLTQYAGMIEKPFTMLEKPDVIKIVGVIESRDYTNWTKITYKTMLKKFVTWLSGDEEAPKTVSWINLTCKKAKKLPEEILTQEEVKEMIKVSPNYRDRAFIAALYETGCRVSELGNALIKHLTFDKYGAVLMVKGKTGQRRVRVMMSVPYLADWLNRHPRREPNAPLWVTLPPNPGNQIKYATIRKLLKKTAKLAGVSKKVNPHAFRHARATHLCNHLTEAQMKEYFGWTQDSSMASVYIHLSGRDVDKAILKVNGIELDDNKEENESLKPVECERCSNLNKPTDKYCSKCGLVLDVQEALMVQEMSKNKDELMNLLLRDPEVKKLVLEKAKVMMHG